jgi:hypothetical protein
MTNGERMINDAIAALQKALEAGDLCLDEAIDLQEPTNGANWEKTAGEIEKCLAHLKAKPTSDLAMEASGSDEADEAIKQ